MNKLVERKQHIIRYGNFNLNTNDGKLVANTVVGFNMQKLEREFRLYADESILNHCPIFGKWLYCNNKLYEMKFEYHSDYIFIKFGEHCSTTSAKHDCYQSTQYSPTIQIFLWNQSKSMSFQIRVFGDEIHTLRYLNKNSKILNINETSSKVILLTFTKKYFRRFKIRRGKTRIHHGKVKLPFDGRIPLCAKQKNGIIYVGGLLNGVMSLISFSKREFKKDKLIYELEYTTPSYTVREYIGTKGILFITDDLYFSELICKSKTKAILNTCRPIHNKELVQKIFNAPRRNIIKLTINNTVFNLDNEFLSVRCINLLYNF